MKIFFRPMKKKEASNVILLLARILKIVLLVGAFASAFGILITFTTNYGIEGFIVGLIGGVISFFLIMISSLLTEALLIGISMIFENNYKKLEDKEEKTIKELFAETNNEDEPEVLE